MTDQSKDTVSAIADTQQMSAIVDTRPHTVKVEPAVLHWYAKPWIRNSDIFPVVVVLRDGCDTKKLVDYYTFLKPTDHPLEIVGLIDRDYLLIFMNDENVMEIREGVHRCNKCSSDMRRYLDTGKTVSGIYGLHLSYQGGYESTPFEDLKRYSFSLCENCLADLFLTFETLPATEDIL